MRFGLDSVDLTFIEENVIDPIEKSGGKVWVYGSRARGDHQKFSDLDLMIEGELNEASLLEDCRELLSNSNLPIKVDLVLITDFAESYKPGYEADKVSWTCI